MTAAYHVEQFTDAEQAVLRRYFTNLDQPVFGIVGLPDVVKGALFARYSRSPKSVRRLFLDEFVGDGAVLADFAQGGDDTGTGRAEALYDKVFNEYGDDSVAQLGGAHLACEQASNLLTKVLERGRLAAYLEQSTRYIFYDQRLGERYRYMVPAEVQGSPHRDRYVETMEWLFDTYAALVQRMVPYYEALYPREEGDPLPVWRSTIRARACDDLRGLLPASTTSNVGIFATGQAYEQMVMRMQAHPSAEVRDYAAMMLAELRKMIPAFMRRVDVPDRGLAWSAYFAEVRAAMEAHAEALGVTPEDRPEVTLVDWDPDAETKIAAAALYAYSDLPDDQLLAVVSRMTEGERAALIRSYVGDRGNRRHKPGRGFERSDYRFDILCDYGIFRDLQRHRLLSIDWQRLSPRHGYVTPPSVADIEAGDLWIEAMERTAALYEMLEESLGPDIAAYVVPFAYRIRFYLQLNAREAFHLIELRTQQGGHPDYRRVCQQMHHLIRTQAGHSLIADAMSYVDYADYDLGRLESERRSAARRAATEG